jgi:DNA processing protein
MDAFPDPAVIFRQSPESLHHHAGVPDSTVLAIRRGEVTAAFATDHAWLEEEEHHLLCRPHPAYPALLAETADPPLLLYINGEPRALDPGPTLAIVGSRGASRAGRETARSFARDLASAGFTIVSGLARGIDEAAHRGALEGGGRTVAVLGSGPDRIYPAEHKGLAEEVAGSGAVVSEYPVGSPPRGGHFPRRNRIVSGLSLGVLVVEAGQRSGALTTARWAGSQGREVMAVPGSIHSPQSRGPHALIRQGAKLVETLADVAEELPHTQGVPRPTATSEEPGPGLSAEQARVASSVDFAPTAPDLVVARSGLTPDRVSAILLELEIQGVVAAEPGGFYIRLPADGAQG